MWKLLFRCCCIVKGCRVKEGRTFTCHPLVLTHLKRLLKPQVRPPPPAQAASGLDPVSGESELWASTAHQGGALVLVTSGPRVLGGVTPCPPTQARPPPPATFQSLTFCLHGFLTSLAVCPSVLPLHGRLQRPSSRLCLPPLLPRAAR